MNSSLESRALAAYFRYQGGDTIDQPSLCEEAEHDGLNYVVLSNQHRTLAVYRVQNSGQLRRLKRWPQTLDH
ncbi:hypothetical protein [Streptomyces sp. UG1]|uniref:hypothetical protein n=1 Tax=Streptomyces sp. UG1 TaxID=3417652 RepID=UPI003CF175DE